MRPSTILPSTFFVSLLRISTRFSSTLRLHRLMTITTAIILRELGELSPAMQQDISRKLRTLFGL